ncbi:MAG TPA: cytochrome c [Steroidobacteraceae bacterium]
MRAAFPMVAVGICFVMTPAWANAPDIARKYCATCHEVTPGVAPRNPSAHAPSFLTISNDPRSGTPDNLAHVISQSHASMPPFSLTATERQSLINYIMAFNTRHAH